MDGENKGTPLFFNGMIWGAHPYFWKHPYGLLGNGWVTHGNPVDLCSYLFNEALRWSTFSLPSWRRASHQTRSANGDRPVDDEDPNKRLKSHDFLEGLEEDICVYYSNHTKKFSRTRVIAVCYLSNEKKNN